MLWMGMFTGSGFMHMRTAVVSGLVLLGLWASNAMAAPQARPTASAAPCPPMARAASPSQGSAPGKTAAPFGCAAVSSYTSNPGAMAAPPAKPHKLNTLRAMTRRHPATPTPQLFEPKPDHIRSLEMTDPPVAPTSQGPGYGAADYGGKTEGSAAQTAGYGAGHITGYGKAAGASSRPKHIDDAAPKP